MTQATRLIGTVAALAALAGCARYESRAQPVTTDAFGASPAMMPQAPNSLPRGSAVSAPLTSATGQVGTTGARGAAQQ